jgi:hypothetical protein
LNHLLRLLPTEASSKEIDQSSREEELPAQGGEIFFEPTLLANLIVSPATMTPKD